MQLTELNNRSVAFNLGATLAEQFKPKQRKALSEKTLRIGPPKPALKKLKGEMAALQDQLKNFSVVMQPRAEDTPTFVGKSGG